MSTDKSGLGVSNFVLDLMESQWIDGDAPNTPLDQRIDQIRLLGEAVTVGNTFEPSGFGFKKGVFDERGKAVGAGEIEMLELGVGGI